MNTRQSLLRNDAGFSLVELMVVAALFSTSMVVMIGALLTMFTHGMVQDTRVEANMLGSALMSNIRTLSAPGIFQFNVPLAQNGDGSYDENTLGNIDILIEGIIPSVLVGTPPTRFTIPVGNNFNISDVPDPFEVVITITVNDGPGRGNYTRSTMFAQ